MLAVLINIPASNERPAVHRFYLSPPLSSNKLRPLLAEHARMDSHSNHELIHVAAARKNNFPRSKERDDGTEDGKTPGDRILSFPNRQKRGCIKILISTSPIASRSFRLILVKRAALYTERRLCSARQAST